MQQSRLAAARILIVEDELLIAMDIEHICLENGAASVLIVSTIDAAAVLDLKAFDVAILDREIAGKSTHEIARRLDESGTPFIFTSGIPDGLEGAAFQTAPLVQKPYSTEGMISAIASVLPVAA